MNSYHKILKEGIIQSGLTLAEISAKLKDIGFSTKSSYLSRLQNGKIPPAREDLNIALASILGIDENELILTSYIEKAPLEFKSLITEADTLDSLINNAIRALFANLPTNFLLSFQDREYFSNKGYDVDDYEIFMIQIEEKMDLLTKWQLYEYLTKELAVHEETDNDGKTQLLIDTVPNRNGHLGITRSNNKPTISIPFFKKLYAYGPANNYLDSYETYVIDNEHQTIPDPVDIFLIQSLDDGMSLDGILEKDKLLVFKQESFEPADILLIAINDQPAILRRIQLENDNYLVRPSNPAYSLECHPRKNINIFGKAVEVWRRIRL